MEVKDIRRIGIIGAGLMGHGIAQVFASAGYDVNLYDSDRQTLEAAKERIESNFKVFIDLGLARPEDVAACLGRVTLCQSLEALCGGCQYILEAILEDLELKRTVFAEVERCSAPDTIFSSNTSAISITEIAVALDRRDRFLGTHFWNPPHVLPCVEVIRGEETGEAAFETIVALMEAVGKVPVRVLKDVPGFLGNRLQHAMWREAVSLCDKGVASAEDIDKVVKYGFGARMPFIGPMETADLAGLVLTRDIHRYLFPHLESATTPAPVLEKLIAEGATGVKAGRGFYEWTPEKIEQIIRQRDTVLLRILREIIGGVKQG
ncbi:MAG: 3-hydroxyacyl-CoA dehydrogenase family protein [Syntrophaceae bacterium]|nr:3-hydroxyacyl-CoA dehydrogenase family protein [Syntrophaceae bacterium]